MGRWAQRTRSGGGNPSLNSMTRAVFDGTDTILVTYAMSVKDSSLSPGSFTSLPSNTVSVNVVQVDKNRVDVVFGSDVDTDTSIRYNGSTLGFLFPQTKAYG